MTTSTILSTTKILALGFYTRAFKNTKYSDLQIEPDGTIKGYDANQVCFTELNYENVPAKIVVYGDSYSIEELKVFDLSSHYSTKYVRAGLILTSPTQFVYECKGCKAQAIYEGRADWVDSTISHLLDENINIADLDSISNKPLNCTCWKNSLLLFYWECIINLFINNIKWIY